MDKKSTKLLVIIFLVGIFMGSLDTAIVAPARTVIGNTLNISADASIWIITLYSLIYAVSMPIMGKLADRKGLKPMFTVSIVLFGLGSLLSGLANFYGGFEFLLGARFIEAIGAGGMIPIATAFIGGSFPPEKRGAALGMVGGINGIATLIGPALGSLILDLFGDDRWGIIFFINIPICIVVLGVLLSKKFEKQEKVLKKMDLGGSIVSSLLILSLMAFITSLNFTELATSFESVRSYPFLIAAIILLPILIFVEKRAEDPIIHLKYFKNRGMVLVFIIAFLVGAGLMVVVFLPQFCSNVLGLKLGSGGYFVTLMAAFSGFAAPMGGKFVDKFSAKVVLLIGFACTIVGTLILAFVVTATLSIIPLIIGLALMGLGVGFTMGTPLNYFVQSSVPKEEIATAQSTLSLIRSLGLALSPNLLVGFIAQSGTDFYHKFMQLLPSGMTAFNTTSGTGSTMLGAFQNANITTIFSVIRDNTAALVPAAERAGYINMLDGLRGKIESLYQTVMNTGFERMFITLAIIAGLAFIAALLMPKKVNKAA
ncbi:MAG: MFS transporter [Sarcina sp.]